MSIGFKHGYPSIQAKVVKTSSSLTFFYTNLSGKAFQSLSKSDSKQFI